MSNENKLSVLFSAVIRSWLSKDELEKVNDLNQNEADKQICHSHDFCDANQAMIDALDQMKMDYEPMDDIQGKLINDAWEISKSANFMNVME